MRSRCSGSMEDMNLNSDTMSRWCGVVQQVVEEEEEEEEEEECVSNK